MTVYGDKIPVPPSKKLSVILLFLPMIIGISLKEETYHYFNRIQIQWTGLKTEIKRLPFQNMKKHVKKPSFLLKLRLSRMRSSPRRALPDKMAALLEDKQNVSHLLYRRQIELDDNSLDRLTSRTIHNLILQVKRAF